MHERARLNFHYFAENNASLLTSSYVLLETQALLQHRVGLPAVQDFNSRIYPLLDIIWVDRDWHNRAIQRVLMENRRSLSLTDCLSFEIMETRDISTAYTFDQHFSEAGFAMASFYNSDQK